MVRGQTTRIQSSRVIRIEQPSKKLIRIIDDGYVFEYMPIPPGHMRFTDFEEPEFMGGDASEALPVSGKCLIIWRI